MELHATVACFNDRFIAELSDGRSFQQLGFREMADTLHHAGVAADGVHYEWHAGQRMITAGQQVALVAAIRQHERTFVGLSIAA